MVLTKVKWSKSLIVYFWGSPKNNGTSTGQLAYVFEIQVLQDHTGCSQDHVHEDAHTEAAKDADDSPFNSGD